MLLLANHSLTNGHSFNEQLEEVRNRKELSKYQEALSTNLTRLKTELCQCVDFDYRHHQFIDYCLMVSAEMVHQMKCEDLQPQPIDCILATYYFAVHYLEPDIERQKMVAKRQKKQNPSIFSFGDDVKSSF